MLNALRDEMDDGGGAATLSFYTAPQPANALTDIAGQTLLATLTFSYPSAAAAQNGVLAFDPITEDSSAAATGKAAWARVTDSDGDVILDCDVSGIAGGATIEINTVDIVKGGPVRCASFTINQAAG